MNSQVLRDINYLPSLDEMGLVNSNLVQINSARSISVTNSSVTTKQDNFLAGVMDFSFSIADKQRFSPYRSYFRAEVEVSTLNKTAGFGTVDNYRQPRLEDGFTLAENFVNNMLANSYFYIGSQSVASQSQYHGQAAMLRVRLSKSYNWLQSLGKDIFWLDPDFQSRQKKIISNDTQERTSILNLGYIATNTMAVANSGTDESKVTFATGTLPDLDSVWRPGDFLEYTGGAVITQVQSIDNGTNTMIVKPRVAVLVATPLNDGGIVVVNRVRDTQEISENSDGRNNIQVCFQPPLSVFQNQQVYPAGSYRVSLFPKSNKVAGLEYNTVSVPSGSATPAEPKNVAILFKNLYFFASVFTAETSFDSGTWYLSLNEIDIQAKKLIVGTAANTTHTFNIPSSTLVIAVWCQDTSSGTVTALNCPPSVFKNNDSSSADLTTLQLTYSNMSKPVQLYTTEYAGTTQEIVQRYYSTAQNANMDTIGGETFDNYLTRGGLYYYSYIRPADDRSTNLQIQLQTNVAVATQLFIGCFYRKLIEISVVDGYVTDVKALAV